MCNKDCIDEAVRKCRQQKPVVQGVLSHLFAFVAKKLPDQTVQSIQIPYFGKFVASKERFKDALSAVNSSQDAKSI